MMDSARSKLSDKSLMGVEDEGENYVKYCNTMFNKSDDVPSLFRQMDQAMRRVLHPWCKRCHYLVLDQDLLNVFKHSPAGMFMIKDIVLHSKAKISLVHMPKTDDYDPASLRASKN